MQSSKKTRIIIADDHQLFISGIRELIEPNEDMEVVAEANDGIELLKLIRLREVDLILLDISMPEMNGREACKAIKEAHPELKVLILTQHHDSATIGELMDVGADGYILKESSKRELLLAIRSIIEQGRYFSRQVSEEYMAQLHRTRAGLAKKAIELTSREKEVLRLIIAERTAQEIADQLYLSINTVMTHRKNLLQKFQVRNTAGLVREAVKMGFEEEKEL